MNAQPIPFLTTLSLVCLLFLLSACAGGPATQPVPAREGQNSTATTSPSEGEKVELGAIEEILAKKVLQPPYDNIIIRNFTSSSQIQTDYPKSIQECKTHIIDQLKNKKTYKNVTDSSSKKLSGKSVIVDLKIVDMRITSGAVRFWGGAFAGSSFMDVLVEVRNAGSEKILYKQVLTTSNNAWAASYNGGSSDTSLPADFGTLIGEYLSKLIPAAK
ncbi:MAG: DUF4410 domain-containing protein [Proteobacteria bacterium]|nr:DUF4410 domain-containing protein [Pseudomonadota bacterium]MBU1060162.1 DUF4410 domain-containing protein [Pseudomonadota bacterium]